MLWTAAYQAPLSFTISWSLLKLMSTESVILFNHLTLCCPLLLLTPVFPSIIRVFSNEWIQCNRTSPYKKEAGGSESEKERWQWKQRYERKRERYWKMLCHWLKDGERGLKPRNQAAQRSWKMQENRFFPQSLQKETYLLTFDYRPICLALNFWNPEL